uniref:DHC_N1 domain-containing protein n=1 Tax=Schistocephalus solidus TaxID=70667 RepID=A0A183TN83_SCHSO
LTAERLRFCLSAKAPFNANSVFFVDVEKGSPITSNNMRSRICMRRMHHSMPVFDLIRSFFLPAIKNQTANLKELDPLSKKEYITALIEYGMNLDASLACVNERVKLSPCRDISQEILRSSSLAIEASHNLKQLGAIEECACRWMRQISLEIQEVDMVREESVNSGPHTEVRFWKQRTTRFSSLLKQLQAKEVKNVLLALKEAHSKTTATWTELDNRVAAIYIEAQQNAKYLQILARQCRPLYEYRIVSVNLNSIHY